MDIDVSVAAKSSLTELARRAAAGDKRAQLELGVLFEEGRGVSPDLRKAESLYRSAAKDSGGTQWIYQPAATGQSRGRVIPVQIGPRRTGLAEARSRLDSLRGQLK